MKKVFSKDTADKGLLPEIYKEFLKLNNLKKKAEHSVSCLKFQLVRKQRLGRSQFKASQKLTRHPISINLWAWLHGKH
jgi:hypothetical protein